MTLICINLFEYFLLVSPPLKRVPIPKIKTIPTAIKRAKLQALEHKKMFKIAENNLNKYFKKIQDTICVAPLSWKS